MYDLKGVMFRLIKIFIIQENKSFALFKFKNANQYLGMFDNSNFATVLSNLDYLNLI